MKRLLLFLFAVLIVCIFALAPIFEQPKMGAHGEPRSGHWSAFRAHMLDKLGHECAACGCKLDPQLHHEIPYATNPALELSESNVLVLCGPGGNNDHLWIGHGGDYRHFNPNVRRDAKRKREMIEDRLVNAPR